MNKKRLLLLAIATVLMTPLATITPAQPQTPEVPKIAPIAVPFNSRADRAAFVPSDLEQSDKPMGEGGRAVIGQDDRTPVLSRSFPWSAIGRLEATSDDDESFYTCTGTLIGRDLVLTNSHCLVNPDTKQPFRRPLVFKPNLIRGTALDEATVVSYDYGWKSGEQNLEDDWALLKLDKPLGETYGYLGWRNLDFADRETRIATNEKIVVAGYSGDFPTNPLLGEAGETAGVDLACSILKSEAGLLYHNCDTNPGASGSAIFALFEDERFYIIGLHTGNNRVRETQPGGDTQTVVINRGVQVGQWANRAATLMR